MKSDYTVTHLEWDEHTLKSVARVHQAAFAEQGGQAWDFAAFKSIVSMPGTLLLGVHVGQELAGFLLLRSAADEAEIITLAVLPLYQRSGIAHALLGAMKEKLSKAGIRFIYLEVRQDNISAIKAYTTSGFVKTGERPGYYETEMGHRMDAFVFALKISSIDNS